MPYQIIHTFEGFLGAQQLDGMSIVLGQTDQGALADNLHALVRERLAALQRAGIDGLVINVGGPKYLEDAQGWELLRRCLGVAIDMGFRMWIYDERGYPSGSAGGLTLGRNPSGEAQGLKRLTLPAEAGRVEHHFPERGDLGIVCCEATTADSHIAVIDHRTHAQWLEQWATERRLVWQQPDLQSLAVYYTGALYEGTHAERNYGEKRRYINLLDAQAVRDFVAVTHQRYARELPPDMMAHVQAFFTDEPSFMSVVLPKLDGILENPIPVLDPPDPRVPVLPSLPYSAQVDHEFSRIYGQPLAAAAPELFAPTDRPSAAKCAYWDAVSRVYEQAYAVQLAQACAALGTDLTGHILYEEAPFQNMILHGNPFRVLKHFHLPGVDLLNNDLNGISVYGHKLPTSCAFLTGKPGIMTETSDFAETQVRREGPASPETMAAALSLQFLLGVRAFTYYYSSTARPAEAYRWVNDVVRRTCAYAADWPFAPEVALYVPFETLWAYYVPSTTVMQQLLDEQPMPMRDTQSDTLRLCQALFDSNVQFVLCDESSIEQLLQRGIRQVILPRCQVVSRRLVEAAQSGALELYRGRPFLSYGAGQLQPIDRASLPSRDEYQPQPLPFHLDPGLRVAGYEGQRWYCFNPQAEPQEIELWQASTVYDPFEDSETMAPAGSKRHVLPGRGLFVIGGAS